MKTQVQPTQSMDKFCIFSSESYVKVANTTKPNMMTETDVTKGWLLKPAATILTDLGLSWQCHPFSAGRPADMFALDLFIHDAFKSETYSKYSGFVCFLLLSRSNHNFPKIPTSRLRKETDLCALQIGAILHLPAACSPQFWPFSNSIVHCFLSFFPRVQTLLPLSTRYHKITLLYTKVDIVQKHYNVLLNGISI